MRISALQNGRGFSLLELLVAIAIVGVLIALMNFVISSALMTTTLSQKNIDAVNQAQLVMNRMALDIALMPVRPDIDYVFSKKYLNDSLSFYSTTEGYYPSNDSKATPIPRMLSVIGYRLNEVSSGSGKIPVLERGARQLDWTSGGPASGAMCYTLVNSTGGQIQKLDTDPNNVLPQVGDSNYQVFGDQVFRMEMCYLVSTSSTSAPVLQTTLPSNISKLSAVIIGIGVMDSKSRALVHDYSKLISAFPDAEDGKDLLTLWSPILNSADFAKRAGIPVQAAQSVRVFQRYLYIK